MKKKLISTILIIILLAAAAYVLVIKKSGTIDDLEINFAVKDSSIISKIIVYENKDTLILEKKDNYWKVNNIFSAKSEAITSLLRTMMLINLKSPVPTNAQNYVKQLLLNSKKVEIFDSQKIIKTFYIGSLISDKSGNYMMLENSKNAYIVQIPALQTDISDKFSTDSKHWKTKNIFKYNVNEISSIALKYFKNSKNSFELIIENPIKILDCEQKQISNANQENIKRYLTYFSNVEFENYETQISKDSLILQTPNFELIVKNKTNQSTKIMAYNLTENNKTNTNYFLAIIDNKEVVKIKYFNFDLILKNIDFFR